MLDRIKKWMRSNLWIVLFDIIAVNGAYLLALLIRFYVHFRFTSAIGDFREYYLQFTPYYTVICLVVFYMCGLYNGMWRYAGLDDMNRIILANVITAAVQFFGTRLFVGRMPTSYYIIGSLLQFVLVAAIRFANRFLYVRRQRAEKLKTWSIPAMAASSGSRPRFLASICAARDTPYKCAIALVRLSTSSILFILLSTYSLSSFNLLMLPLHLY